MITERPLTDRAPDGPPTTRRRLGPRRGVPSGRAALGGLLVAGSAIGAIALAGAGSGPDVVPVVVADGTIEAGAALGPDSLRVEHMALPAALVDSTYADTRSLEGTVSRSRLVDGELLQPGDVVESTAEQRAAAPAREVSVRLDADRVVGGRVEAGDRVDVLATYGTGVEAVTVVVLADASVLAASSDDDGLGSGRSVVLTLALVDRAQTVALAHAIDVAALNVVRTTTSADDDGGLDPYTAPTAAATQDRLSEESDAR